MVALGLIDATEKDSRFLLVLLAVCVTTAICYILFSSTFLTSRPTSLSSYVILPLASTLGFYWLYLISTLR